MIKRIWHSLTVEIKFIKLVLKYVMKLAKSSLNNIFQNLFNKILSQQLTDDRSYISGCSRMMFHFLCFQFRRLIYLYLCTTQRLWLLCLAGKWGCPHTRNNDHHLYTLYSGHSSDYPNEHRIHLIQHSAEFFVHVLQWLLYESYFVSIVAHHLRVKIYINWNMSNISTYFYQY